jgi:excisionase family DNA binding protein
LLALFAATFCTIGRLPPVILLREPGERPMAATNQATLKSEPEMMGVLTAAELAVYLRAHRSSVYRLLRSQQLPGFKVGGHWLFRIDQVNAWIEQNTRRHQAVEEESSSS